MTQISRWADGRGVRSRQANATSSAQTKGGPGWTATWLGPKLRARVLVEAMAFLAAAGAVAYSAILTKAAGRAPALAMVAHTESQTPENQVRIQPSGQASAQPELEFVEFIPALARTAPLYAEPVPTAPVEVAAGVSTPEKSEGTSALAIAPDTRWFNGRPVRPKGYLKMRVTAYSPDERSCGDSADGITATLHSVETNGFQLVAADPRLLKYGSMLTVPGYAGDKIVPVLDCGGKIKGSRLDVLYPTHEQARKWGSQMLTVTVWEYADGKPATNPRKAR